MDVYQLLSSGSNAKGQLAHNTLEDSHIFRPCYFTSPEGDSLTTACPGIPQSIRCGSNHTILLLRSTITSRCEIWGCGDNQYTLMKTSNSDSSSNCTLIFQRMDVQILSCLSLDPEQYDLHAVASSWNTTFIVIRPRLITLDVRKSRDLLVSFGSNELGILGLNRTPQKLRCTSMPLQIKLWELFTSTYGEALTGFRITHITAGVRHIILVVCLYLGDMDVVRILGWGACRHGQLGDVPQHEDFILCSPTFLSLELGEEVESVALGNQHTVILSKSGRIHGLGSHKKGQLDYLQGISNGVQIGTTWNGSYVTCRSSNADAHSQSWYIVSTGSGNNGQLGRPKGCSNVVQFPSNATTGQIIKLVCGSEHVMVCLTKENVLQEVWGWGWNEHGNLGIGDTENADLPVLIHHTARDEEIVDIWAGYGTSWIAVRKIKQLT